MIRDRKAFLHDSRQVAGVIEMGVREHDRVERLHVERRRPPVQFAQRLEPLEQAAIDEHVRAARFEQKLRAGDGTVECELAMRVLSRNVQTVAILRMRYQLANRRFDARLRATVIAMRQPG